jgi:hypothetical protein
MYFNIFKKTINYVINSFRYTREKQNIPLWCAKHVNINFLYVPIWHTVIQVLGSSIT